MNGGDLFQPGKPISIVELAFYMNIKDSNIHGREAGGGTLYNL